MLKSVFKVSIFLFAFGVLVNCGGKSHSSKTRSTARTGQETAFAAGSVTISNDANKTSKAEDDKTKVDGSKIATEEAMVAVDDSAVKESNKAEEQTAVLEKATCENPLTLENSEAQLIEDSSQLLQKGKWNLISLEFYLLDNQSNESYYVTASSTESFVPKVACNGLSDSADKNSKNLGKFEIAEWVNHLTSQVSDKNRSIEVRFENNVLVSAITSLKDNNQGDLTPLKAGVDRLEVAPGVFVTVREYLISSTQFEIRIKMEHNALEEKHTQYARAVFQIEKAAATVSTANASAIAAPKAAYVEDIQPRRGPR